MRKSSLKRAIYYLCRHINTKPFKRCSLSPNFWLVVLLLSISVIAHGQTSGLMRTDLISPSPTAANLGKYGEIPVTYYTGIPNVSIPIFNVTGNELSVPITLTYNFNGHQPLQKSSWVGLGWSLQAGGVITRTIGDKVETDFNGYDKATATNVGADQQYLIDSYQEGYYDNQPDIFSYNFANYSGKFVWENGVGIDISDQRFHITHVGSDIVIRTLDGTVYTFGEKEQTTLRPSAGSEYSVPAHTSSWYLTKITNATNTESIRFYYESDGTVLQYGPKSQSLKEFRPFWGNGYEGFAVNPGPNTPTPPNDVFPTKVTAKRLSSIVSDKFSVSFLPGDARQDILTESGTSSSLRIIHILSCDALTVKQFTFEYDYFGNSAKFLKLKSVTDNGIYSGARIMKHSFEYFNESGAFGTGSLSAVDKFGYLMGDGFMSMYISNDVYEFGANREPVFEGTVSGALKKITYPTGGSTVFDYEPNRFYDGEHYVSYERTTTPQDFTSNHTIRDGVFELFVDDIIDVTYIRTPINPQEPFVPHNNAAEFEIHEVYLDANGIEQIGTAVFGSGTIQGGGTNNTGQKTVSLTAGKYVARALCDVYESQVDVIIKWTEVTNAKKPGPLGPGIRLSELTHDNGMGNTITKKFSYTNINGFSSGVLLQNNFYHSSDYTDYYHSTQYSGGIVWENHFVMHNSVIAETPGLGLPHYYQRVVEETVSGNEKHRSVYEFDYFSATKSAELVKKTDYQQTGQVGHAAGGFIAVAKTENSFNEYQTQAFGGMDIFPIASHINYEFREASYLEYGFNLTLIAGGWKHPRASKYTQYTNNQPLISETKSYYNLGTRNLTATKQLNSDGSTIYTKYKYAEDYTDAVMPLKTAHIFSPVIEEQVWRKNPAGDSVLISGKINEYSNGRISAIHVLESAQGIYALNNETKTGALYSSLISDTNYKKKVEFKYDATGRVIQQQLTDDTPVSYKWAYPTLTLSGSPVQGNSYPVAEVKNAKPDSVFYTSFEDVTGTSIVSATGFKAKADTFKIKKTFTGSYVLTYWKKTGANPWQLIQQTLTNPSNYIIGTAGSYIDEVRLHPVKAQMTTYTYRTGIGIATVNDPNNKISYYQYDAGGRLKTIKDHKGNIINEYQYHVKDQISIVAE